MAFAPTHKTAQMIPLVQETEALRRLPPYVFAELDRLKESARASGQALIDLGIGSPDLGIAPDIVNALSEAARDKSLHGYPAFRGSAVFLEAIQRFMHSRFGVSIDSSKQVTALSGAKEGIAQLLQAVAGPGDLILVPEIHYPVYARASLLTGADIRFVPMRAQDNFILDLDAISAADLHRARVLIVNYPNNPTGARVDRAFLQHVVDIGRQHRLLVLSDLAYSELTFDGGKAPSILECDGADQVAIEFHSLSKTFSMAGLRIGFAVGNAQAIDALADYRLNVGYGSPTIVQHAAAFALDHRERLVPLTVATYRRRRDVAIAALGDSGWKVPASAATMFLWLRVPAGVDDWDWVSTLIREDGVVVTPGIAFGEGGRGYFRVSLVRDDETLRGAAALIAARRAMITGNRVE